MPTGRTTRTSTMVPAGLEQVCKGGGLPLVRGQSDVQRQSSGRPRVAGARSHGRWARRCRGLRSRHSPLPFQDWGMEGSRPGLEASQHCSRTPCPWGGGQFSGGNTNLGRGCAPKKKGPKVMPLAVAAGNKAAGLRPSPQLPKTVVRMRFPPPMRVFRIPPSARASHPRLPLAPRLSISLPQHHPDRTCRSCWSQTLHPKKYPLRKG